MKPGLIAAGIVSSWTWAATLLTSSTFAYSYGVIGPMGYGVVGTWTVLLFALIAIKIKSNAPGAHTFPEIVLTRHGKVAHLTYLFYGLVTNLLTGACLVLGGSQVIAALTGMNVYASIWLIPIVVGAYVIAGGLRSTFIADYVHTVILIISIFIFGFTMYTSNSVVGSPGKLYDLLVEASIKAPVPGNHEGSYLSFRSEGGILFAIGKLIPSSYNFCQLLIITSRSLCYRVFLRLARPGILAASHRISSRDQRQSIHLWCYGLVRYSIWVCHSHGTWMCSNAV